MIEGVDPALIKRIKVKMQNPVRQQQVRSLLRSLSKSDLQNANKVKKTLFTLSQILHEPIKASESEKLAKWIIAREINPANKLHLLKLWSLFA